MRFLEFFAATSATRTRAGPMPAPPMSSWPGARGYLAVYLDGAELCGDPKGPLFRTIGRGTGTLTRTVLPQATRMR
jgi:hypothetical protein